MHTRTDQAVISYNICDAEEQIPDDPIKPSGTAIGVSLGSLSTAGARADAGMSTVNRGGHCAGKTYELAH
jgi:hypothetical protein